MIQIYSENNTNYDTNGDVVLDPEVCDLHVILNGTWEIELIAPIDEDGKFEYIAHNAKICVDTPVGEKQLFRIYDTEKTDTDITAYARPIFMDSARDVFFVDTRPTGLNGQACLNYLMAGTPYSGESNIQLARTAYYVRKNLIEALAGSDDNSFLNRWGGEIVYDNYKIIMNVRTGEDNDVRVEYGTNIESIKETIDVDSMATRIVPVAFNGRTLDGDEPWVDSPRINDYPIVYTQVVEFSNMKLEEDRGELSDDDDDAEYYDTLEELQAAMIQACEQLYVDGYDLPNVTLDIDMIDLRRADEYKNYQDLETVNLGDTVHCYHRILGIETEARIIEFTYDCITKTIKNIVIGDYQESYLDHISEVTASSGTTVDFSSINNRLDYIEANYIKTVELDAEIGKFGYLTADEADITYARITELDAALIQVNELIAGEINAVHIDVDALDAEIANIISLLSGNIGTGTLDTIHLTADNAVIDSAVIMAAIMEDAIIGNLLAGVIYTDYITIKDNENGNMVLTGPTIQFTDSDGNYRMQLGLDGDGNFNIYIFNDLGDVIFDALGLTEAGLIGNGAIIRDVAVADDANISGYKLNIQEVATILNADGSLIVDAGQVIINGETLYTAFTEIQQTADSALTEAEKALEAAGGLIEIGARNYLLNTRALTQESKKTIYTNMELTQDESDFGVLTETGAGSVLMLTAISAEKNSLGNKNMVFSCDLREENLTEILDDYDLEFGIWTSEDGGASWSEYESAGSSLGEDGFFEINRSDLSDDQWSRLIAKFTAPETELEMDPVAFAIYSADDNSLTFYAHEDVPEKGSTYDNKTVTNIYTGFDNEKWEESQEDITWNDVLDIIETVIFDSSFKRAKPVSLASWFYFAENLTSVVNPQNINLSHVTTIAFLFSGCSKLSTIDLSGWDTSNVITMCWVFSSCSSLETLNLTGWDTSKVTNMNYMFRNCNMLKTIYVSDGQFNLDELITAWDMFVECTSIVGGNGTVYDKDNVEEEMAHIDMISEPGYFTAGNHIKHTYNNPVYNWASDNSTCTAVFTCEVCGDVTEVECKVSTSGRWITASCSFNGEYYSTSKALY